MAAGAPRSPWAVGGAEYPAGALVAIGLDAFLAGDRAFSLVFEPDEHTSLEYYAWTLNHLLLATLSDVKTELRVLAPGTWAEPLQVGTTLGATEILGTDPDVSDEYLLDTSGYTEPATLVYGHIGGEAEVLKQAPAFFDAEGMTVEQYFATSEDGTRIPYFVVRPSDSEGGPTLLTGYGGFEVPLTPAYSGVTGRGWLARGGTYVVANIRGGGEYGPSWHTQASRPNGTACTKTSPRWPRTWSSAASPRRSSSGSRAAATAAC